MPNYIKTTESAAITLTTSAGDSIATRASGITFTPITGALDILLAEATDSIVQSDSGLKFTITPPHDLILPARITLTLPTSFTLSSTCELENTVGFSAGAVCSTVSTT